MSKSIPPDTRQKDWKDMKFSFLLSMLFSANMPVYQAQLKKFFSDESMGKRNKFLNLIQSGYLYFPLPNARQGRWFSMVLTVKTL